MLDAGFLFGTCRFVHVNFASNFLWVKEIMAIYNITAGLNTTLS
jgi:hypothetical protein